MYSDKSSIKQWAEEDRPREKLILRGKSNLSSVELLSIVIGQGTKNISALEIARKLMASNNNSLRAVAGLSLSELQKLKGIGKVKAIGLIAAFELGRRKQAEPKKKSSRILSSEQAFEHLEICLGDLAHEEFKVLFLNRGNFLIRMETISIGGVAGTVVDPKILFKKALEAGASSMILAHNHPSGNLEPSMADKSITNKLVRAGDDLEIKVLDHLIIGGGAFFSFADEGLI